MANYRLFLNTIAKACITEWYFFFIFIFLIMNEIIPDPDEFANDVPIEVYEDQENQETIK